MKKIINVSNSDLLFPRLDFSIQSKEIKIVTDDKFNQLSGNPNIKEVIPEIKKMETIKEEVDIKVDKNKLNKK
jgi:hypothetical protein